MRRILASVHAPKRDDSDTPFVEDGLVLVVEEELEEEEEKLGGGKKKIQCNAEPPKKKKKTFHFSPTQKIQI